MTTANRVLPGFRISLGYTMTYLSLLVFLPLAACLAKAGSLPLADFLAAVWTPRAQAAYGLTVGASLVAALASVPLGVLVAWVLVRYHFPGKRFVDALVDLPFALPTAVAGLVYSSLYVQKGWLGRWLVPLGIHGAYSRLAVVLVLYRIFTSWIGQEITWASMGEAVGEFLLCFAGASPSVACARIHVSLAGLLGPP